MIADYRDPNDKDAYLKSSVVFYLDHDIPIKNSRQFLKEIECRAKPDEITITEQIKTGKVKFADKWITSGWRLFCYDDYATSFKYNLDIRFERLVNGHFRKWSVFMNKKSLCLHLDKAFEYKPNVTWGEFIELSNKRNEHFENKIKELFDEVTKYIVPFFHSTKIIAASNKAEYALLENTLQAGFSLNHAIVFFRQVYNLPVWERDFSCSDSERLENSWNTLFHNLHQDILYVLNDMGREVIFADPFYVDASFYFEDKSDIESFNSIINERFAMNLPLDSNYSFWQIEVAIVTKNILRSLKDKPLPETINYSHFSNLFDNPKEQLREKILSIISSGNITYLGEPLGTGHKAGSYIEFLSEKKSNGFRIIVIIKGLELGGSYEIVNVYTEKVSDKE